MWFNIAGFYILCPISCLYHVIWLHRYIEYVCGKFSHPTSSCNPQHSLQPYSTSLAWDYYTKYKVQGQAQKQVNIRNNRTPLSFQWKPKDWNILSVLFDHELIAIFVSFPFDLWILQFDFSFVVKLRHVIMCCRPFNALHREAFVVEVKH